MGQKIVLRQRAVLSNVTFPRSTSFAAQGSAKRIKKDTVDYDVLKLVVDWRKFGKVRTKHGLKSNKFCVWKKTNQRRDKTDSKYL